MSKSFKNNEELIKFIKFIVVGLINTIFQLGIYYFLLFAGVNYNISFAISFMDLMLNIGNEKTWQIYFQHRAGVRLYTVSFNFA